MLTVVAAFTSAALPQALIHPAPQMQSEAAGDGAPPFAAQNRMPPGPHGPRHEPAPLELAATLSAAELYVGITPEQLGAWRAYTSALITLFDFRPEGPGPRPQGKPPARPPQQQPEGLFGEDLADRMIAVSDKAKALKDAAATLRAALTPEQAEKLDVLRQTLRPHPGPHGQGPGRPHAGGPDNEAPEFAPEPAP